GRRVVERCEPICTFPVAGALGQFHALVLPRDRDERLVACSSKEEVQPDPEDERDTQQRRVEAAVLDLREQSCRRWREKSPSTTGCKPATSTIEPSPWGATSRPVLRHSSPRPRCCGSACSAAST